MTEIVISMSAQQDGRSPIVIRCLYRLQEPARRNRHH